MAKHTAVIYISDGVVVRLPIETTPKHYDPEKAREVIEKFAQKIGGNLLYLEDEEAPPCA